MSNGAEAGLTLRGVIASMADGRALDEPVGMLQWAARHIAVATYTDPQWETVRTALELMTTGSSIGSILDRQDAAMSAITNNPGWKVKRPTASEIQEAEADLRNHLPHIAEVLGEVEQVAYEFTSDTEKRQAIERIGEILNRRSVARLSPFALLVVLWWFFVLTPVKDAGTDVAVLALWYGIADNSLGKRKD
jgi:hypothetical protein